jgi:uncharacterized membrane protein YphA (DoxX/SURF4 family)
MDKRLILPAQILRMAFGLTATLAGLDKFFNILADWQSYISPFALHIMPIPAGVLMAVVGVVEIAVGVTILAVAPRVGAYIASAWLLLVALNLAIGGHFDVAVRDIVMSIAAFTLARLVEARELPSVDFALHHA